MKALVVLVMLSVSHAYGMGISCELQAQPCDDNGNRYHCTYFAWAHGEFCSREDVSHGPGQSKQVLRCETRQTHLGNKIFTTRYPVGVFHFAFIDSMTDTEYAGIDGNFNYGKLNTPDGVTGELKYIPGEGYISQLRLDERLYNLKCELK
ncbi:MAG: hypothetical protein V4598_19020 [Bdellovibrionota bacterium]